MSYVLDFAVCPGFRGQFDVAYKDHPRSGYIGLQDRGSPCWFKDIRIRPLER